MSDDGSTLEEFRKKYGAAPATVEMLCAGNDAFMDVLKQHKEVIAALKARVEKLESRPLQKWAGVFIEGTRYSEASLATHKGSLWAATCTTTTVPGSPGSDWRLIVKRGTV
jgi:hypothetical protein